MCGLLGIIVVPLRRVWNVNKSLTCWRMVKLVVVWRILVELGWTLSIRVVYFCAMSSSLGPLKAVGAHLVDGVAML